MLAVCLGLLVFINCYSVKWGTVTQNVFTFSKVFALVIIIVAGVVWLCLGNTQNYENAFTGSKDKAAWIALAIYQGIFSFSGWSYLNFVTEELKDPFKNLPKAIYISLPVVTAIYVLTNVAYFAVLTADQMMDSTAVAVDFAEYILGGFAVVMPIFVALSTVGSLNGVLFTSSRMFFVGARDGLLPDLIAMINIKLLTPMPSLLILGILSLLMLTSTDVYALINYVSFTESLMFGTAVAGLLYLRWKKPEMPRPIKLNLSIPIAFCVMCIFLLILPFFTQPHEVAIGTAIVLSGIPVFYFHKYCLPKLVWFRIQWNNFTRFCQKLAYCVPEEAAIGSQN
ncbi:unnamed protein product [Soboliphyme baturini]|uniref:Large neutral amino acids transporter small subunit 2 n=1 Tax=Soboliphyme baturini TaxID=241478 RepID=A0A183IX63_9BILA|nr:unnamed protein product [Soboliphyme baturini]